MTDTFDGRVQAEIARRLDEITNTPGAILKFDRDGDGKLDGHEWEILRSVVAASVVRDLREVSDPGPAPVAAAKPPPLPTWKISEEVRDPHVDLDVQEVIDARYDVLKQIGSGSQGQTFLARVRSSGEYVAVKEMAFSDVDSWKSVELFEREAQTLRELDHPAIPSFVDSFHSEPAAGKGMRFFLVQEFVAGEDLGVLVARGKRWSEPDLIALARELLEILSYLHGLHPVVVHRDLKPSNIIRKKDGTHVLIDFGGVQLDTKDLVGGSTVVGTTGYMPPEQLVGRASPLSDLYGVGATLVHLCTGIHPSKLPQERLRLRWQDRCSVSGPLAQWVDRLLEPVPEDRPASAREAAANLPAPSVARGQSLADRPSVTAVTSAPAVNSMTAVTSARAVKLHTSFAADIYEDGDHLVADMSPPFSASSLVTVALGVFVTMSTMWMWGWVGTVPLMFLILHVMHDDHPGEVLRVHRDGTFRLKHSNKRSDTYEDGVIRTIARKDDLLEIWTMDNKTLRLGKQCPPATRLVVANHVSRHIREQR